MTFGTTLVEEIVRNFSFVCYVIFSTKNVESLPMNLFPPCRCFASSFAHFSVSFSLLLH
jgi:hypothetical protein